MTWFASVVLALILGRWLAELGLEWLNRRHVLSHAGAVPEAFRGVVDEATYRRAVEYTLARNRLAMVDATWATLVLLAVLFSGVLPRAFEALVGALGGSVFAEAGALLVVFIALALPDLPLEWWAQFRLEQRFGFNTSTQRLWWLDRAKGLVLMIVLVYPLLLAVLAVVRWVGSGWWVWAWGLWMGFQLLAAVLAPVLILPWFNKLTPLPEGALRERLLALARRTGFRARGIEVMDGSKRSRHSNAFFTGLGRFRKIVLFDTLVGQLAEPELEAVLAHEIGHSRLRHILKTLALSAIVALASFAVVAWLAEQRWFFAAFGFTEPGVAPALLLFVVLSGVAGFWFAPLTHMLSRRFEYEADAFARAAMNGPDPLIAALRKLHEKNLSNLTPHPLYSSFHYSHPTLSEREAALRTHVAMPDAPLGVGTASSPP